MPSKPCKLKGTQSQTVKQRNLVEDKYCKFASGSPWILCQKTKRQLLAGWSRFSRKKIRWDFCLDFELHWDCRQRRSSSQPAALDSSTGRWITSGARQASSSSSSATVWWWAASSCSCWGGTWWWEGWWSPPWAWSGLSLPSWSPSPRLPMHPTRDCRTTKVKLKGEKDCENILLCVHQNEQSRFWEVLLGISFTLSGLLMKICLKVIIAHCAPRSRADDELMG